MAGQNLPGRHKQTYFVLFLQEFIIFVGWIGYLNNIKDEDNMIKRGV
jgi:hypothetical protein